MAERISLSKTMTERQFVHGYWYAREIKKFAKEIGIVRVSKLRKDELEALILNFLRTGHVDTPTRTRDTTPGVKDSKKGLHRRLPIIGYTNDASTKKFLRSEAKRADPQWKPKSGAMYRLNRWREEQLGQGKHITYGDLVDQYVALCRTRGPFPPIPSGRYINFVSDFLRGERRATRQQALKAWAELKRANTPKTYAAWKKHNMAKRERPS